MAARTYNFNGLAEAKMDADVVRIIKVLFAWLATQGWASRIWPGSGWRTGSAEHSSGRAVDIMITGKVNKAPSKTERAAALELVADLIRHGKTLGIQWLLFSLDDKVTWSYNLDRGTWKKLGDRGSVSANHRDHIHLYFKTSAKLPTGFTFDTTATTSKPKVKMPPYPVGIGPGKSSPSARELQQQLKRAGFMPKSVKEADHYGPATKAAVARFHAKYPAYKSDGVGRDERIGPKGWAKLWTLGG